MAKRVILLSDLSNAEDAQTVGFSLTVGDETQSFEIDLTDDETKAFAALFAQYIEHGRTVKSRATKSSSDLDLSVVRSWATARGLRVSEKGRVADKIQHAYKVWQSANDNQSEELSRKADELIAEIRELQVKAAQAAAPKDLPTPAVLRGVVKESKVKAK